MLRGDWPQLQGLGRDLFDPPILTQHLTPHLSSFAIRSPYPGMKNHVHMEKQSCELDTTGFPLPINTLPRVLTLGSFLSSLYFSILIFLNHSSMSYF